MLRIRLWACETSWGTARVSLQALALPDLVGTSAVNSDSPASDPTVFHKRYLKKIRDLGEVRPRLESVGVGMDNWGVR